MQEPSKGLSILNEKFFEKDKKQPSSYYFVKGDCQEKLNETSSAIESFNIIVDDIVVTGYEKNK